MIDARAVETTSFQFFIYKWDFMAKTKCDKNLDFYHCKLSWQNIFDKYHYSDMIRITLFCKIKTFLFEKNSKYFMSNLRHS